MLQGRKRLKNVEILYWKEAAEPLVNFAKALLESTIEQDVDIVLTPIAKHAFRE